MEYRFGLLFVSCKQYVSNTPREISFQNIDQNKLNPILRDYLLFLLVIFFVKPNLSFGLKFYGRHAWSCSSQSFVPLFYIVRRCSRSLRHTDITKEGLCLY